MKPGEHKTAQARILQHAGESGWTYAFLVGVDREACAHCRHALDRFAPPGYSGVAYTGGNNDYTLLEEFHFDTKRERQIRRRFGMLDQQPDAGATG